MEIIDAIRDFSVFDLLVVFFLFAMFILGFMQGVIRRLLGIASILFSFLVATQAREPIGSFLASNWYYHPEYSYMIGYAAIFAAGTIAFTLVLQAFYKSQQVFPDHETVEDVLGGALGVLQGLIFIAAIIMILDPFFELSGIPVSANEFPFIRSFHEALGESGTAAIFRQDIIPTILSVAGGFFPESVRAVFPGR